MAQYYQLVGQGDQPIQAVTIEELRQYYPNLTCVESGTGVQYVINQEEASSSFQSQQVLLTSADQHIVLNSGDGSQQVIVDQSQIYQQTQQYVKPENEVDYPANEAANQQIYYTTSDPIEIKQQPQLMAAQQVLVSQPVEQRQLVSPQIINAHQPRPVAQPHQVRNIVPQEQINNTHIMQQQRRLSVGQNIQQTTPQRVIQTSTDNPQFQQQQNIVTQPDTDPNQLVQTPDGRIMTIAQLHDELALEKKVVKTPARKRAPAKPRASTSRGRATKARGGVQPTGISRIQTENQNNQLTSPNQKSFHSPVQQPPLSQNKAVIQYTNTTKVIQQTSQHQPLSLQQLQQPVIQQRRLAQHVSPQQQVQTQQVISQQVIPQQQTILQQAIMPRCQGQISIPPNPGVHNGNMQRGSYSPPNSHNQVQQLLDDSCSSSVSDEYRDSAKMLVCLENGEQRLITFTVPKETCTVQDLLEQVGVPFTADTHINCMTNTGLPDIDYVVSVGSVNHMPSLYDTQQVLTVDTLSESQECIVSQSGAVIPVNESALLGPPVESLKLQEKPQPPSKPVKEVPRFVPGYLALCAHCGYLSEDFNRCQRCKNKMKDDVKAVPTSNSVAKQQEENKKNELKTKLTGRQAQRQNNGRGPKTVRKGKQKTAELEPVILTLSSDDEDSPKLTPSISTALANRILDSAMSQVVFAKEPVYPENLRNQTEEDIYLISVGRSEKDGELSDAKNTRCTAITCRTVRIGSYKFVPREEVAITSLGIKIITPLIKDPTKTSVLFVPVKYILKILVNFNKALPVMFIYVMPSVGVVIRKALCMEPGSELYFDPVSKEEPFRRITLLPEIIGEETKNVIKEIFTYQQYNMIEELSNKEANDILIRTCPRDIAKPLPNPPIMSNSEVKMLLIYPPPPGKGGITINVEDYLCLATDQFLNDVIIDFYLKYLIVDVLDSSMQEKVHVFSSFFYKRLTTKPVKATKRLNPFEIDPNLTPAQKRHCRVKKWTKNVNIFEKEFIIIPINENSHWFLAIICFPGLEGARAWSDTNKIVKEPPKEKKKKLQKEDKNLESIVIGNTTITLEKKPLALPPSDKPIKCDDEPGSDRDEAEGDESELEESEEEEEPEELQKKPTVKSREPIKQPCILIFDSLGGSSRSRVVATLRDYLTCEHRTKLNSNRTFTKENIKGACPKVPQQQNFTDCGLYVLQYVESFFMDPIIDYHIPIKQLKNWFEEIIVTRKREEISSLIKELMTRYKRDFTHIPDIQFPTLNGIVVTNPMNNSHDDMEEHHCSDEEEEEMYDGELEPGEIPMSEIERAQLVSEMYNSEDEDEIPEECSSKTANPSELNKSNINLVAMATSTNMIISEVGSVNSDSNDVSKKSNRDTMSYLKSKRISRHKNNDNMNDTKKQRISE